MKAITVDNLKFSYDGRKKILDGISFEIEKGQYVGITGDSGCGKSTLCHILCGIAPSATGGIASGNVILRGKKGELNMRDAKARELAEVIGFVMQDSDRQIIASSVEDELAFGPENLCIPPEEIRGRVHACAELLGIGGLLMDNPNNLSGGQKQMVAIGSILTLEPEIIVLDEPFSHLDEEASGRLTDLIEMLKAEGKTVIAVEHNHEAIENADRHICIKNGRIEREY